MANYDPLETCPYDPVHRIMRSRMQCHLVKCAKNWPCTKKKQCPYDARHIINEIEFNYHVSTCPQRESVMRYKIVENAEVQQPKFLPIDSTSAAATSEENWEEDGRVKSYNPLESTKNRPVIRLIEGAPKAQRKLHQKQERLRIARLEDAAAIAQTESTVQNTSNRHTPGFIRATVTQEPPAEIEQEYKPLRRPKKLPLDNSKVSDFSTTVNDSTIGIQTQNSIDQNKSLQTSMREKSSGKENVVKQRQVANSYASVVKQQKNRSIDSDYDVVIESVKIDGEKDSSTSLFNNTIDDNLVKVNKTFKWLTIGAKGHKIQSESLDRTLESLKKTEKIKSPITNGVNNSSNNDKTIFTKERRSLRCAANFSNSQRINKL